MMQIEVKATCDEHDHVSYSAFRITGTVDLVGTDMDTPVVAKVDVPFDSVDRRGRELADVLTSQWMEISV